MIDAASPTRTDRAQTRPDDPWSAWEAHRRVRPDGVCLAGSTGALTYAEVWERVQEIDAGLTASGLPDNGPVVVALRDPLGAALVILATTGRRPCCPVDPAIAPAELSRLVRQLGAAAVVLPSTAPHALRAAVSSVGAAVIQSAGHGRETTVRPSGHLGGTPPDFPSRPPALAPLPEWVRLVLPTSGTTGRPRLVCLSAAQVTAGARATAHAYRLGPDDRRLNAMPLFHVQGVVGTLMAALVSGGSVFLLDSFDPQALLAALASTTCTWLSASPSMYQRVVRQPPSPPAPALRFLRVGSGALDGDLRAQLEARFGVPVIESYGMTQAHQIASSPLPSGAIGMVPTGSEVRVAAGGGLAWAPGVTGELFIRGPNVSGTYIDVEGHLVEEVTADGWLPTGDIGRVHRDGSFSVSGRLKEVIDRGGEKIAPAEIDAVLTDHPLVARAAAYGAAHPDRGEEVCAAVVPAPGADLNEADLIAFAAARLTPVKVPRRIWFTDRLPTTTTGKVARHKLAELAPAEVVRHGVPHSPDDTTGGLEDIWAAALGREVGDDEDFFRCGGDSMGLLALLSGVERRFGVRIDALTMYEEAPTRRAMADLLRSVGTTTEAGVKP